MKGIMDLLVAAKLVTLSEEEAQQSQYAKLPEDSAIAPDATPSESPVAVCLEGVAEPGQSFEEIFRAAGIPVSPFPAERLLRLLDGLRAMDDNTRKAAVRAMDEADENWTIDDPVLDAQRKIAALEAFRQGLDSEVRAKQEKMTAEIAALNTRQEQTSSEIRRQISELEKLLEREMRKTMEEVASLESEYKALQSIVGREGARIEEEIARLRQIPAQFGQVAKLQ
ncbi:MAG: hypothetical protein BWY57_00535 [Betaproteobacteria bacterium ADurb.Bin341]|nr:MAG: hypothetical protein BWY57_00535 [Betaproteobacteria bacterium ADurb.Bin341]